MGEIVRDLGGGRLMKDSVIDSSVGIDQLAKPGDVVERRGTMARVHARTEAEAKVALARLEAAFEIGEEPPEMSAFIESV